MLSNQYCWKLLLEVSLLEIMLEIIITSIIIVDYVGSICPKSEEFFLQRRV